MDIDLKKVVQQISPNFFTTFPGFFTKAVVRILERVTHLQEIQAFFEKHGDTKNWEFIDAAFEYLDFRCCVSDEDIKKIPSKGNLICVANHPLGILDGLSLLKTVGTVRRDVKIVVSDVLAPLENLKDLFLFYDLYAATMQKKNLEKIRQSLLEGYAIIFFPAGSVAKLTVRGVREGPWRQGPVLFSRKYGVPVLPMYIHAENSLLYYCITLMNSRLSTFFLPHEMFRKRSSSITLKIGDPILKEEQGWQNIDVIAQTEALKNHVLELGKKQ